MTPRPPRDDRDLRELFREVYEPLYRYCVRLSGDPDAAEDIAQQAFVRLLESGVDGGSAELKVWLFTTAGRLVRDRERVERNRRRLLKTLPGPDAPRDAPDTLMASNERRQRVRLALDTLSERDRRMLLLSAEGFTYREIGAVLDITPSSVGALLLRARKRLARALLEPESDDAATG